MKINRRANTVFKSDFGGPLSSCATSSIPIIFTFIVCYRRAYFQRTRRHLSLFLLVLLRAIDIISLVCRKDISVQAIANSKLFVSMSFLLTFKLDHIAMNMNFLFKLIDILHSFILSH